MTEEIVTRTTMRTAWGAATDTGRVRILNEDAFLAASPLFLVADGMGGHAAGDIASRTIVEECAPLTGREVITIEDLQQCFARAVDRMRTLLSGRSGGATTAGAAVVVQDDVVYWLVFNVGDSRVYRATSEGTEQVSVDHSVVQELIEAGELSVDDALTHADRHVITRALSTDFPAEADYWLLPAAPEDRLLICTDGLTDELSDAQINLLLRAAADPQEAADALVAAALSTGGRDNVTVVVVDALAVGAEPDEGGTAGTGGAATGLNPRWDEQKYGVTQPRDREGVS